MRKDNPSLQVYDNLKDIALGTIKRCTHRKQTEHSGSVNLLQPTGDKGYPSFWVRDCAMIMQSGLVPADNMKNYIRIVASYGQNGPKPRYLENGLYIPEWAVADHINDDGGAVFYPGMYSSTDNQGTGAYGFLPPLCDNYFFVMMVGTYTRVTHDFNILNEKMNGLSLFERLKHAFEGYEIDPDTGLCFSEDDRYTVDFGFHDSIHKSGYLLSSSILRWMASKTMAYLCRKMNNTQDEQDYSLLSGSLRKMIVSTFYDVNTGWMWSATGICHQHDVWGTAISVYLGILQGRKKVKTAQTLLDAYRQGNTIYKGYVRQIPLNENYSSLSAWKGGHASGYVYQNGGWWATATGIYAKAVSVIDDDSCLSILNEFIKHTEKYKNEKSPFEWISDNDDIKGTGYYGTSGTGPYCAVRKLIF